jgi:hypothetical protein
MVRVVQAVRAEAEDRCEGILYVGAPAAQAVVPPGVSRVATTTEALKVLREQRFAVLVVDPNTGSVAEVKRLARLDREMFLLVAAGDDLTNVSAFAHDCDADGVVTLPLSRQDITTAVERASRLGTRVAHCVKLYELCRSLLGSLKQRDLVRTVLDVAPRVIPADNVALFLVSAFCESPAAFECHASESPVPEHRGLLAEVTSLVARRGKILSDRDVGEISPSDGGAGWQWLACPLFGAEGVGGAVVFLRSADSDPFSPHERHAAATFSATVANALDNSRDYRELESKVRRLTRERQRAMAREAITIARNLGGAVAHEVSNAMTVVASNVDALAHAAQDQELWQVAKEAAEYLLVQGEPTGQRLASRIMQAGAGRNTDGLVMEIAGMIDECLEGVRRVSEMAHALRVQQLPPARPATAFDASELLRAPSVTQAVVHRPVVFRNSSIQPLVAAKLDVEEALACVLQSLDADALAEGKEAADALRPVIVRIEDCQGVCTISVDAVIPSSNVKTLQSLLTPTLRVDRGRVFRFDASLAFAHALLARNGLDLWVEPRSDGGVSFVISPAEPAA